MRTVTPNSYVETQGAKLAIYEDGPANGSAIILIHGGPGVPDYLDQVAAILASQHRVFRYDQRGTGKSVCRENRYLLTDYVDDLESIRRACGLERISIFGHSWGGMVGQLYASRHADRIEKLCLSIEFHVND